MYPLHAQGRIVYEPRARSGVTAFKSWWTIIQVPRDIVVYYKHLIWENYREKITESAWGPHITIVRGERPRSTNLWKFNDRILCDFQYSPDIQTNGKHFWVPAQSVYATKTRLKLGLDPNPRVPFHITIGSKAY